MPVLSSATAFLDCVQKSGLVPPDILQNYRAASASEAVPRTAAERLVAAGLLTPFQAGELLKGRHKGYIVGRYKILAPLGAGGMGQVFLAEHRSMRHRVALKVLPAAKAKDAALRLRFLREAQAAAALNHPNIVRAHDFDSGDGFYYLVLEYIEGVSLQQLVEKRGPLAPARAAHYVAQAALGVQHIHEAGLVHRDLKPDNLLLDRGGTVKILDLGLALFRDDRSDSLTRQQDAQTILGTADYLSPEQALESHDVDVRSDLYSLGATFYFLLSGRPPFTGQTVQKLMQHQLRDPDKLIGVPDELAQIVVKLMAKRPEDRYPSPLELLEALLPFAQEPVPPPTADELAIAGQPGPVSRVASASTARASGPQGTLFSLVSRLGASSLSAKRFPGRDRRRLWLAAGVIVTVLAGVAVPLVRWVTAQPSHDFAPTQPVDTDNTAQQPREVFHLTGHQGAVRQVAVAPDGRLALSAGADATARLWDLQAGKEVRAFTGHVGPVLCAAFDADGRWAVTGGQDGTVRIWDVSSGQEVRVLHGPRGAVWAAAFAPDGATIVTGGQDGTVRLWDAATGQAQRQLQGPGPPVFGVAFGADGRTVAIAGADKTLRLWDATTGRELGRFIGHRADVAAVALAPDGKLLLSCSTDSKERTVRLWDVATGKELPRLPELKQATTSVAFSADGQRLAAASADNRVRIWDADTGQDLYSLHADTMPTGVAFLPDGDHLVTAGADGSVRLWELPEARQTAERRQFTGHVGPVQHIELSTDGRWLVSASHDRTARLWNVATGAQVRCFAGHAERVLYAGLSPDGRRVATACQDGQVYLWDRDAAQPSRQWPAHEGRAWAAVFAPDGRSLATCGEDRRAVLWDAADGQSIRTFTGHEDAVTGLVFAPDGRSLLTASADGTVREWDVATGQQRRKLMVTTGKVTCLALSSDGRHIVTGDDGEPAVKLWDWPTGRMLKAFAGGSRGPLWVAIDRDGRWVAAAELGSTVRVWDRASGQAVKVLTNHQGPASCVAFLPDGRRLLTSGFDRTIRLWTWAEK